MALLSLTFTRFLADLIFGKLFTSLKIQRLTGWHKAGGLIG
jgi:hypothetical protein